MTKVDLIKDRCIGCGACMVVAPENFTFDDDGRAEMINSEATDEAIEASETCPVSAIVIENENCNCEEECNCEQCDCEKEKCNCHEECTCDENCNCTPENKCSENCTCNE